MTEALAVLTYRDGPHTVVAPQGDIFFDTIGPLREVVLPLAGTTRARIVLDLSAVTLCDSSGLNLMVQALRLTTGHGGWLRIAAARPKVRAALEITNLTRVLPIHPTVAEALDETVTRRHDGDAV